MIRSKSTLAVRTYEAFRQFASRAQSPLLLVLRLYWGWLFLSVGWMKLHSLGQVAQGFSALGIPMPGVMAPFIACVEFFGGLLLIVGLASRVAGLVLAANMLVALATAHRQQLLALFTAPEKFFTAAPSTFLIVCLVVLIFGPGRYALDSWLAEQYPEQPSREVIERRLEVAAEHDAA